MMPYAVRLRRVERGAWCLGASDGTADLSQLTMPLGEHPLTASLDRQVCWEEFHSSSQWLRPRAPALSVLNRPCRVIRFVECVPADGKGR